MVTLRARKACPLCGCREQRSHDYPGGSGFIVCARCSETLYPHELVPRVTRRTRRRYCLNNFNQPDYPGETV